MILVSDERDFGCPWIVAGNLPHHANIVHHHLAWLNSALAAFIKHDLTVKRVARNMQDFSHDRFAFNSLRGFQELAQLCIFGFQGAQLLELAPVDKVLLLEMNVLVGQMPTREKFAYIVIDRSRYIG